MYICLWVKLGCTAICTSWASHVHGRGREGTSVVEVGQHLLPARGEWQQGWGQQAGLREETGWAVAEQPSRQVWVQAEAQASRQVQRDEHAGPGKQTEVVYS
jgi:hypothetical protein